MPALPALPAPDDTDAVVAWVAEHLGDLTREAAGDVRPGGHRGGQTAADVALAGLDVTGYARTRSNVLPVERQGASRVSPYLTHGLLDLPTVWDAVADAPSGDRRKYRDELLWQEYARHVYARVGPATREPLRREPPHPDVDPDWDERMACIGWVQDQLEQDGWLVNQVRTWWASHWTVRHGRDWRDGEDHFYRHLLDGSRAANRLGWQWTIGAGTGKPYGFSRWQVEKRASELCGSCVLRDACPVQEWPDAHPGPTVEHAPVRIGHAAGAPGPGPDTPVVEGGASAVWLTPESMGDADPALEAHPDLPVVYVFDEPKLAELRWSGKRLVFLAETLADLATRRDVEVRRGVVGEELAGRSVAVTFAPVPWFTRRSADVDVAALHPWRWLERPTSQRLTSYSAWRKGVRR
ncbi:FAD-binding domain-containing protein [Aeromicrobium erythreum]|uniref:Deoxyribodipyrimidine photolyase n=1 Tax=Aeromicrobium erythreum TaxID=2041 RepID=A0A0U4CBH5_9ACTN|nr:FAD-binding domain-containing protein [Aeromicrobium erythreum]ALX05182.1 deoxyribodipyrimidine photolyase [Aeromicrobium erythreum]